MVARRLAGTVLTWVALAGAAVWLSLEAFAGFAIAVTGPGLSAVAQTEAIGFLELLAPVAFVNAISASYSPSARPSRIRRNLGGHDRRNRHNARDDAARVGFARSSSARDRQPARAYRDACGSARGHVARLRGASPRIRIQGTARTVPAPRGAADCWGSGPPVECHRRSGDRFPAGRGGCELLRYADVLVRYRSVDRACMGFGDLSGTRTVNASRGRRQPGFRHRAGHPLRHSFVRPRGAVDRGCRATRGLSGLRTGCLQHG